MVRKCFHYNFLKLKTPHTEWFSIKHIMIWDHYPAFLTLAAVGSLTLEVFHIKVAILMNINADESLPYFCTLSSGGGGGGGRDSRDSFAKNLRPLKTMFRSLLISLECMANRKRQKRIWTKNYQYSKFMLNRLRFVQKCYSLSTPIKVTL